MFGTDQELVERAKRGDNAAFGMLWANHERQVVSLCRRYLHGAHRDPAVDEDDLAADVFIRALHGLDRYEDRSTDGIGFDAWLLEVARRLCLKFLAKQRRRGQWTAALDDTLAEPRNAGPSTEQLVASRELRRLAAQEINALPDLYRGPFKLSLEEFSQKEIAATFGISVETAAKRVQRARALLRCRLSGALGSGWVEERQKRRRPPIASFRALEQRLTEIVTDCRVVTLRLPTGGEMQLCIRVDRQLLVRVPEIEVRRAWLRSHPRAWKRQLELAEACFHSGRWEEARQEYQALLAVRPGCVPAALRLGRMLQHEQRIPEAISLYRAALRRKAPPTDAAQLRAHLLAAQGKDEEAASAFRRAIALDPREKTSYFGLSAALGRLSRYEEQLETLARVRRLDPNDVRALTAVYTPCARLGRFDLALPLLERAVALDPNDPLAIKHLFQARMNLGLRDGETQALAERLVSVAPEFVASWGELAWFYTELGQDEEALAVLHQFLGEHPDNAEAHAALAWRYHYLRRSPEQVAHARRAYELEPENWHVCWALLTACGDAPDLIPDAEAAEYVTRIAAQFPHDAGVMQWIAGVYCLRHRETEACEYARRAVACSPTSPEAQAQLAATYRTFGRWKSAAGVYEVVSRMPGGKRWLADWGAVLRKLRDPRADEILAEAVATAKAQSNHVACGLAYEAWGKREEAIAAYRHCLTQSPLPIFVRHRVELGLQRLGAYPDLG